MNVTFAPATRTKTKPSISNCRSAEVRLVGGGVVLGRVDVTIEWPEPFRGEIRDVLIPIHQIGLAKSVEIEGDGIEWAGGINPTTVRPHDTVTFPYISLPVV